MSGILGIILGIALLICLMKSVCVVPQQQAWVIQQLGKYKTTLDAGLHFIVPFFDDVAYKHTLKEQALDVPPQQCITSDNITVEVDGILYLRVMDPKSASYGISNYLFACTQLAQTTMRSEIGKLLLDRTFVERDKINSEIVDAVDKASAPWGVKVTRYEIKSITPPQTIRDAMEKQMRAEREKRAKIAESEGDRQARINRAEGEKQELIEKSEGEMQKRTNEAQGRANEIGLIAEATAEGLRKVANVINQPGGTNATNLRLAEQYLTEFGKLAKANNTMIIPADLANIAGVIKAASSVITNKAEG